MTDSGAERTGQSQTMQATVNQVFSTDTQLQGIVKGKRKGEPSRRYEESVQWYDTENIGGMSVTVTSGTQMQS